LLKINGELVGNTCFPNNERILKSVDTSAYFKFELTYEGDNDIFTLIMYKRYLDDIYPRSTKELHMMYVPYSRMDREIEGFMFSLKYFCQTINELKFDKVYVFDTHSNITKALLNRNHEFNVFNNIYYIFMQENIDYVFYPDAGAMKRYSEMLKLPLDTQYFFGNKKRNLQTGEIIKFELVDAPDLNDKTVLIIDDLCSKGGTFLASAKEIKNVGASKVLLYVSHCENSIYDGGVLNTDLIDKVYTTDSILQNFNHPKLHKL
jgi:ribose-phosphate pyrophosphokinase